MSDLDGGLADGRVPAGNGLSGIAGTLEEELRFEVGCTETLALLKREEARKGRRDACEPSLRTFLEAGPFGAHILDPRGMTILKNGRWDAFWDRVSDREKAPGNVHDDARVKEAGLLPILERAFLGETVDAVLCLRPSCPEEAETWIEVQAFPVGARGDVAVMVNDVTTAKRKERELTLRASRDGLTGLVNRTTFIRGLEEVGDGSDGTTQRSVLFVDLDDFKLVNDTMGHEVGDRLLQVLSRRLEENARSTDTVARLGGDEFVVLFEGGEEGAEKLADRLVRNLREPVRIGERLVSVTCSIGVASVDGGSPSPDSLVKAADKAMYASKLRGKNRYSLDSLLHVNGAA